MFYNCIVGPILGLAIARIWVYLAIETDYLPGGEMYLYILHQGFGRGYEGFISVLEGISSSVINSPQRP
jgi:hypothetical protein